MDEPRNHTLLQRRIDELEQEAAEARDKIAALERSGGHLQAILNNANLPIFLKGHDYKYILINQQYEKLVNITNDAIAGKTDFEVFPPPVAELFRSQDQQVMESGAQVDFEETVPLPDGELTFLTSKFPVMDAHGKVYALGGVCTDITSLKTAQNALKVSEGKLRSLFVNTPLGMYIYRLEANDRLVLVDANPAASLILGVDCDQFLNQTIEEAFPPLADTEVPERYRAVCRTGVPWHSEQVDYADGVFRGALEMSAFRTVPGMVAVFFSDVTRRRQMEADRLKLQKLESVGVLAGGIAHDFNNLLAVIVGNLSLATHHVKPEEREIRDVLEAATEASLMARELTQQLLTFSKGGAPVRTIASIAEVIEESVRFALHGSNTRCEYEVEAGLWPVEIDAGQMSQVIHNIVLNASQTMPDGGVVRVGGENVVNDGRRVPALPAGALVKLSIQDQGPGITPEALARIFDPYFTTKERGSGLGLAITHSIIVQHEGHIAAESKLGHGTTMHIYLPAAPGSELPVSNSAESARPLGQRRILVMDDDAMVRRVVKSMGDSLGCEVLLAKDGTEAIRLYRESLEGASPIDIVIMDLTVPGGMGGKAAVQELLALDEDAHVVVSSGYSNDPIMANYGDYGFKAALSKPYALDALAQVVSDLPLSRARDAG